MAKLNNILCMQGVVHVLGVSSRFYGEMGRGKAEVGGILVTSGPIL